MKSRWKIGDIPPIYNSPLEQYNHEHRPQPRPYAGKGMYYFAVVVWILNLIACLLCFFIRKITENYTYICIFFFLAFLIEEVEVNLSKIQKVKNKQKSFFDHCINISRILGIICLLALIIITSLKGGGAGIWNGEFSLMDHGDLVKFITEEEYWKMTVLEAVGFVGGDLFFSSYGLRTIRQVYLGNKNLTN